MHRCGAYGKGAPLRRALDLERILSPFLDGDLLSIHLGIDPSLAHIFCSGHCGTVKMQESKSRKR